MLKAVVGVMRIFARSKCTHKWGFRAVQGNPNNLSDYPGEIAVAVDGEQKYGEKGTKGEACAMCIRKFDIIYGERR